ncbi:hypothetical protein BAU15_10380 [Enterococcus sp. JM4C]|uniref:hypothetical protein n=1 Tax=Candidatus Enterococcus huntleyi TaxID=1857217 RepID=UPI0013797612|nr:hypothetical protein [Enterococcus sp. JM4C]KAF1296185.1 hypothetical protein BAU15_10380 [Enterococcus sp. JM4C]
MKGKIQLIFTQNKKSYLLIAGFAGLFIMPHLLSQNMIIGSDAIFHFNRFYDTAQQIREGNFNYFISQYGFQQSGRIVNAFYGPFLAYLHGLIVLLSKNWFVYQVSANFLLYVLSGSSMLTFLKSGGLSTARCRLGAVLYMSSFAILYWVMRQGFTSWGAAVLPLSLSIIFEVIAQKKVPKYKLALGMALLFQTHLLTAFFGGLIYLPIFSYAFIQSKEKRRFVGSFIREVSLFVLLTLNLWFAYATVARENTLATPFVNATMSSNTINQGSFYWLVNPVSLLVILIIVLFKILTSWQKTSIQNKLLFSIMLFFLLLSTSLIPWNQLVARSIQIVELIQFPFRFFVPVTILAIYLFLALVDVGKLGKLLVLGSSVQVLLLSAVTLATWESPTDYIKAGSKVTLADKDSSVIKVAFHAEDKQLALSWVEKPTPDYVPLYGKVTKNKYSLYEEKIVQKNKEFEKEIGNSTLVVHVKQNNDAEETEVELPITVYKQTVLRSGGKEIPHDQIKFGTIGTPIIPKELIKNQKVEVSYQMPGTKIFISVTLLSWGIALVGWRRNARRKATRQASL